MLASKICMNQAVMRQRDRTAILAIMLRIAEHGASKTKIMYLSQLTYKQLNLYIPYLLDRKLLDFDEESRLYQTTAPGKDLLRKIEEITQKLDVDDFMKNKRGMKKD